VFLRLGDFQASTTVVNHSGHAKSHSNLLATVSEPDKTDDAEDQHFPARPGVLALSDHITCLRHKKMRGRDDVSSSCDQVITNRAASEPAADSEHVNGEWYEIINALVLM